MQRPGRVFLVVAGLSAQHTYSSIAPATDTVSRNTIRYDTICDTVAVVDRWHR